MRNELSVTHYIGNLQPVHLPVNPKMNWLQPVKWALGRSLSLAKGGKPIDLKNSNLF